MKTTNFHKAIAEYIIERNDALLGTLQDFITFAEKQRIKLGLAPPPHPDVYEITYHKMRTAVTSLPMEHRRASKRWLIQHGFHPLDDGDVDL